MRRLVRCIPAFILFISLWSVQGCDSQEDRETDTVLGPGGTSEDSTGKRDTITTQPRDTGKTTVPPITIVEIGEPETWRTKFIKDSSEIPVNGFRAFYFEDSTPSITAYTERVPYPDLSYDHTGPQGIPAGRFHAYWIGRFTFPESATWRITLSQGNSVARILVDKREIYSGRENRSLLHVFAKGDHLVEIEYENDSQAIRFSALLAPVVADPPPQKIDTIDTADTLDTVDTAATEVEYWYASAYESGNLDRSLNLVLKKSSKPVILVLSSYEAVHWNVRPADSGQVLAVFVDSFEPQSTVAGLRPSVPVTRLPGIPIAYKFLPDCTPEIGVCAESEFKKLVGFMKAQANASLTGHAGAYDPISLTVPETILDSAKYREIEDQTRALIESNRLHMLADVFPGDTAATWQAHFLASGADIPTGRFQAFYFSDKQPDQVLLSEPAAAPAIEYSWTSAYGLGASDFAGYWIGNFTFAAPTTLIFRIDQSHAQTAIFVDKQAILANPEALEGSCTLQAGTHLIEIQHVNNWHTIEYSVSLETW